MLSDLAGALGSAVGDVVREVKSDMAAMTPPATAKPKDSSDMMRTVAAASGGLAHVEVGGNTPPEMEIAERAGEQPRMLSAPWEAMLEPGRIVVDGFFLASATEDVLRYMNSLAKEGVFPYTLALVAVEASDAAQVDMLTGLMESEPRLFGMVGAGPRHLAEDLDALDARLTELLNGHGKMIAFGPVGLDEPYAPYALKQQKVQLAMQLELAADFGLPTLVGHRRSLPHLAEVLAAQESLPPLVWADVLAEEAELELVMRYDMYVLVRPELTFEGQAMYKDLLMKVPAGRHILSSGGALVAPASRSGHPGGPENLLPTLKAYAELTGKPVNEVREALNRHARALFVTTVSEG